MRAAAVVFVGLVGCASTNADPARADAGAPTIDASVADTEAGPRAILPYPPGPYGTGAVGERLADFRVQGYAMSPTQRDSTKLPFRDISVAEARSKPGCGCLLVVWDGAGQGCQFCVEAEAAISAGVLNDESVCALSVVSQSFDSFELGRDKNFATPPTRSDLDLFTQSGRHPFPVGLVTDDAMAKLGASATFGIPTTYAVRASDMRIAGMVFGRAETLVKDAKTLCAAPLEGVQTLASGITARAFALDATHAYVADAGTSGASGRIARVGRAGGTLETVATTADAPEAIALGASEVYWATAATIGASAKTGGASRVLTNAPPSTKHVSIAADGTHVFFARSDGTIGRVPIAGGAETILATNEAGPTSLLVDGTNVYWLDSATGEVASVPEAGGARASVLAPADEHRASIIFAGDLIYVREAGNVERFDQIAAVPKAGGERYFVAQVGITAGISFDATAQFLDYASASIYRDSLDTAIGFVDLSTPSIGSLTPNYPQGLTLGRQGIHAVASGGDGYVYWITGGAVERMKR